MKIRLVLEENDIRELQLYTLDELQYMNTETVFSAKRRMGIHINGQNYYLPLSIAEEPKYKAPLRMRIADSTLYFVESKGDRYEVSLDSIESDADGKITFYSTVLKEDPEYPVIEKYYQVSINGDFDESDIIRNISYTDNNTKLTIALNFNTVYYLRLKTINEVGTYYSNVLKFKLIPNYNWLNFSGWKFSNDSYSWLQKRDGSSKCYVYWGGSRIASTGFYDTYIILGNYKYVKGPLKYSSSIARERNYYIGRYTWNIESVSIQYL